MRIHILRHCDRTWPEDGLSETGHREAAALASHVATLGVERLFSSPLKRSLDTARYTGERLGLEVEVEPWMEEQEEWLIDQEPWGEMPIWGIDPGVVRDPERLVDRESWHRVPGLDDPRVRRGFAELEAESDRFFARLGLERQGGGFRRRAPGPAAVAVFCHLGFGLAWIAALTAIPLPLMWAGFSLPAASETLVEMEPALEGLLVPRCLYLGRPGAGGG